MSMLDSKDGTYGNLTCRGLQKDQKPWRARARRVARGQPVDLANASMNTNFSMKSLN
jgi:hypothetical protein